jgi:LysM repeat protein
MIKLKAPTLHRIFALAPVFFLLPFVVTFTGCTVGEGPELVSEREERNFQRGRQLMREGRRPEALAAFLSVIEKRRDAPESHLEAGELFRTHMRDPVMSIYHYRKFLEQSPNSPQAPHVLQLIDTAKKDFVATLPAQPMETQLERIDLLETVERLKRENLELKRQVEAARQDRERWQARVATASPQPAVTATSAPATQSSATATRSSSRVYTVVPGDTLSHISGKVYGTSTRWRDIFEANRDVLPNENSLRIGMQLRIPE